MSSRTAEHISPRLKSLTVQISTLTPDPANVRLHGTRSIEGIKGSLLRFGQQKPIVVDSRGVVIAGNGLLEAAKQLGWKRVAAVRADLAGVERTAFAIADNRIAELSSWDNDALQAMLSTLPQDAIEASGFTEAELEAFAESPKPGGVQQDEAPEVLAKPVSRKGDLWLLGENRLLCGDCTNEEDVQRLMGKKRAVLFATDPPYLVDYDGTNHPQSFTGGGSKDWSDSYGTTWDDADGNSDLYDRFIAAAVKHAITPNAAWYCWHASRRQAMLEQAWNKAGAFVHCQIIWAKNRPVLTRTWYMWQHEPCLFGWIKGKKPKDAKADRLSTVWAHDTIPNGEERPDHPTPKPVELFAEPMRQHTAKGDICFEPFSGSGTQLIAAEQLARRCFATEIEPRYVDVAVRRWEKLTGKPAKLEGGPSSWTAVAKQRKVKVA